MSRRLRRITIVTTTASVAVLTAAGLALASPWSSAKAARAVVG